MSDRPDKLIVKGIAGLEGEYPLNMLSMLSVGHQESLTNREGHRVKVMSGVRAGELAEAFGAGDNDVMVALAAIVLSRAGKRFSEEVLWDAPMGSGVEFDIGDREPEDAGDPPLTPPSGGETNEQPEEQQSSSGAVSTEDSASQASDPSPTGALDSPRSAISDLETSAI